MAGSVFDAHDGRQAAVVSQIFEVIRGARDTVLPPGDLRRAEFYNERPQVFDEFRRRLITIVRVEPHEPFHHVDQGCRR